MRDHTPEGQNSYWEHSFTRYADMFGNAQSEPAVAAARDFKAAGVKSVLELGAGQGRDSLFFAGQGLHVTALDYSQKGVDDINAKAQARQLGNLVALRHDAREPLPFEAGKFDACYSHMLFCMAFTMAELIFLSAEAHRVLRPGGLCVYTVRHHGDPNFCRGTHIAENMYEYDGFIVHFFDQAMVQKLAKGYETLEIVEFEEGQLPRKLHRVTMRKA